MSIERVPGGHAIMLKISLPDELIEVTNRWVADNPERREAKIADTHLTVAFLGRDLHPLVGDRMVDIAESRLRDAPRFGLTTGKLSMFGRLRDHLVANVFGDNQLNTFRRRIEKSIDRRGLSLDRRFGFNPHVTLAKGAPNDSRPSQFIGAQELEFTELVVKIGNRQERFALR